MHLVDHVVVLLLFVVQPIHGAFEYQYYAAQARAGRPVERIRLYQQTAFAEWLFLILLIAVWIDFERPVADLGFTPVGGRGFWIAAGLCVAAIAYFWISWRGLQKASAEEKLKHIESLGDIQRFVPHTQKELHNFYGVSVTAGVVEEIIYRGFLIWYLGQYMPVWAAVVLSSVAFGLAHSYQGVNGVLRVVLIGLVFGALYIVSGSIWLPIVAHALLDILQGAAIHEILRDEDGGPEGEPA